MLNQLISPEIELLLLKYNVVYWRDIPLDRLIALYKTILRVESDKGLTSDDLLVRGKSLLNKVRGV